MEKENSRRDAERDELSREEKSKRQNVKSEGREGGWIDAVTRRRGEGHDEQGGKVKTSTSQKVKMLRHRCAGNPGVLRGRSREEEGEPLPYPDGHRDGSDQTNLKTGQT
jgi:hypothetical protein